MFSKMECLHLEEADLSRKCAVESNSTFPSGHQNQVFQGFSWVGYVHLSVLEILIAVSTLECRAGPRPG